MTRGLGVVTMFRNEGPGTLPRRLVASIAASIAYGSTTPAVVVLPLSSLAPGPLRTTFSGVARFVTRRSSNI